MAEISPLPLLPETPSPPLPDAKLQNHFAVNKTQKEQLEMFSKTSRQQQQKMFTGSKSSKEELLSCNKTDKQENLFIPPARVRHHHHHHHQCHDHQNHQNHNHDHYIHHDHINHQGPAARVRNPSKRDRTRKHSSGKLTQLLSSLSST